MTIINGLAFTQLTNLNVLDFLYVAGTPISSTVVAPLVLDSSSDPLVAPLQLQGGGSEDDYTHINSGLEFLDANGDEIWHIWGGDPNEGNTGFHNLFIGLDSGHNVFGGGGSANTAVGSHSYEEGTTGNENSCFGTHALNACTSGSANSAFGAFSLNTLTTGGNNSAFGSDSMFTLTTGSSNTGFGFEALHDLIDGNHNVAVGSEALTACLGSNNTAVGNKAGHDLVNGDDNIAIGNTAALPATANKELNIGNVITGSMDATLPAIIIAMQTIDPGVTGALWNNGGTVEIS